MILGFLIFSIILSFVYIKTNVELSRISAISKTQVLAYFSSLVRGAIFVRTNVNKNYIF
jgi:hypothetical protein